MTQTAELKVNVVVPDGCIIIRDEVSPTDIKSNVEGVYFRKFIWQNIFKIGTWVAVDEDGLVNVFEEQPVRVQNCWLARGSNRFDRNRLLSNLFEIKLPPFKCWKYACWQVLYVE